MKRWANILLLGLLLGLGILLVLAWLRSHWIADGVFWKSPRMELRFVSSSGVILLACKTPLSPPQLEQDVGLGYTRQPPHDLIERLYRPEIGAGPPMMWRRAGLALARPYGSRLRTWAVTAPYWLLLTGLSLPLCPRLLWRPIRRWRRTRQGRCGHCGYDLRASPDRCPECGRPARAH